MVFQHQVSSPPPFPVFNFPRSTRLLVTCNQPPAPHSASCKGLPRARSASVYQLRLLQCGGCWIHHHVRQVAQLYATQPNPYSLLPISRLPAPYALRPTPCTDSCTHTLLPTPCTHTLLPTPCTHALLPTPCTHTLLPTPCTHALL
jgi:hypothetical protein